MKNSQATHKQVAKTLRYCGYDATCVFNANEKQPYEVKILNISDIELNEVITMIWNMFRDSTINIVK